MTPETENDVDMDNPPSIVGDVIGNTAYSERFVLKILLKLANQNTLQEEIKEPAFEQELCTLWDMTAERDVVIYLQTHDALNLFIFALPVVENNRISEIIMGTIANMCCYKEAVNTLISHRDAVKLLLQYMHHDSSDILIQLLRLVSSCLYVVDDDEVAFWLGLFTEVDYPNTLYFILKYSSNKEVLIAALENFNTICLNCQLERFVEEFSGMFLFDDTHFSLYTAHSEYCKLASPNEKLERLHMITLQMMLHLGHNIPDDAPYEELLQELANKKYDNVMYLVQDILVSYESKIDEYHTFDSEFVDVLTAAGAVISYFELSRKCVPGYFFTPCYNMWRTLIPCGRDKQINLQIFKRHSQAQLANIMCTYMINCSVENLINSLDELGTDYENMVGYACLELRTRVGVRVGIQHGQNVPIIS